MRSEFYNSRTGSHARRADSRQPARRCSDGARALFEGRMPRSKPRTNNPRSLKVTEAFKAFVLDQLEELGEVTAKRMFGGVGLYYRGVFFGILARDTLYFKTSTANRPDYL